VQKKKEGRTGFYVSISEGEIDAGRHLKGPAIEIEKGRGGIGWWVGENANVSENEAHTVFGVPPGEELKNAFINGRRS